MTQQEIQQRNQQIALMLGWYKENNTWKVLEKFRGGFISKDKDSNLQFHSDWNWLMEAVEFIESKGYEIGIFANRVEIITTIEENRVYETGGKTKKEAVFIAVSDFARQFNLYKL
jgi:hypothetical protein